MRYRLAVLHPYFSITSIWLSACIPQGASIHARLAGKARMTTLTVNGTRHVYNGDPARPLLWFLRDSLGLTGTRFGCGAALCGACTVHVNGEPRRSCSVTLGDLEDANVKTIEGLGAAGPHPLQLAWIDLDVPQCGYCQSGQLMQAAALLAVNSKPTDEDIDMAMSGNICRCGTYPRIRAAIKQVAYGKQPGGFFPPLVAVSKEPYE